MLGIEDQGADQNDDIKRQNFQPRSKAHWDNAILIS